MEGIKHESAMAYVSAEGMILSVNAAFAGLLGVNRHEILPTKPVMFFLRRG